MSRDRLESVLIVYQNAEEHMREAHDDWYSNIHVRDAMRIDGAIGVERFFISDDQLVLDGKPVQPHYWTHTIYEWSDLAKAIKEHAIRIGTPAMEVAPTGIFEGLRDCYYQPAFLSDGFSAEQGFRRGRDMLTAMIRMSAGEVADFAKWFREIHVPHVLSIPGVSSAALFEYSSEQSLELPNPFNLVAVYGLSDRKLALSGWSAQHDAHADGDLMARAPDAEIYCWTPCIERLRAKDVEAISGEGADKERKARARFEGTYLSRAEIKSAFRKIIEAASK